MIELAKLTPFGRKQWVKRKWDEYEQSRNARAIAESVNVYSEPTDEKYEDRIDRSKWKATIDRKVNYLLARKPVCTGHQDRLDALADFIKESARELLLRGSLIWIVQGDGESIDSQPFIMKNTIAIYKDEAKEEPACFIRKYVDLELSPETGEETEISYFEVYYDQTKETFCYSKTDADKSEVLKEKPTIIELAKTGTAPLFAYVERLLGAFDHILKHQDTTVDKNTKPLVEVRGYSGTSDEDLEYAVNELSVARTDGNGGVTIHTRSMDSTSVDLWTKRLMNEYYEATATVGKDNELVYAQSGKAMDRLFIDMENSAKELAHILEEALKQYFAAIGIADLDIVWNTDRPVDDTAIISGIQASTGILSQRTLLEQHPWVDDVDEELKRLAEENGEGMEDLTDDPDSDLTDDTLIDVEVDGMSEIE